MQCKTVDSKMYPFEVRTLGREKRIFRTVSGVPFFRVNSSRVYLDNVLRMTYPIMYEDKSGNVCAIEGYYSLGYTGYLVEILDGGEAVQLWEEV